MQNKKQLSMNLNNFETLKSPKSLTSSFKYSFIKQNTPNKNIKKYILNKKKKQIANISPSNVVKLESSILQAADYSSPRVKLYLPKIIPVSFNNKIDHNIKNQLFRLDSTKVLGQYQTFRKLNMEIQNINIGCKNYHLRSYNTPQIENIHDKKYNLFSEDYQTLYETNRFGLESKYINKEEIKSNQLSLNNYENHSSKLNKKTRSENMSTFDKDKKSIYVAHSSIESIGSQPNKIKPKLNISQSNSNFKSTIGKLEGKETPLYNNPIINKSMTKSLSNFNNITFNSKLSNFSRLNNSKSENNILKRKNKVLKKQSFLKLSILEKKDFERDIKKLINLDK